MNGHFELDNVIDYSVNSKQDQPATSLQLGRPEKAYEDCSIKTKKRKIQPLLEWGTEKLALTTQMSFYSEGKRDTAALIH